MFVSEAQKGGHQSQPCGNLVRTEVFRLLPSGAVLHRESNFAQAFSYLEVLDQIYLHFALSYSALAEAMEKWCAGPGAE